MAEAPASFSYITTHGRTLRSTHGVPLELRAPAGYRILRPTSRQAEFDKHAYRVTLAAFAGKRTAIMFHAEKVTDASGASNYDKLPASPWRGFRRRSQCATINADDIREEHDLQWLAKRGWNPAGNLAIEQHLKTTPDHNQEVVVSLIAKVSSCDDKPAVEAALRRVRSQVRVRPI